MSNRAGPNHRPSKLLAQHRPSGPVTGSGTSSAIPATSPPPSPSGTATSAGTSSCSANRIVIDTAHQLPAGQAACQVTDVGRAPVARNSFSAVASTSSGTPAPAGKSTYSDRYSGDAGSPFNVE
jgi:hypothetical protein